MEEMIHLHLNGNLNLFFSNVIKSIHYDIYYSDVIEDEYWNYAYLKDGFNFERTIKEIILKMKQLNRKPVIYITSNVLDEELQQDIRKLNLDLIYTDCWMFIEHLNEFKTYKINNDFEIYKVDKRLQDKFIKSVMDGFSGDNPDDPYNELPEGYKISIERSFKNNWSDNIEIINYLGMKKNEPISTATAIYNQDKAVLYNITTLKKFQKKGFCKEMMYYIFNELSKLNIKEVCIQTEKGYYPEEIYKKMGFKEKLLGKAYLLGS